MEQQPEKKHGGPTDHLANERTLLAWIRTGIALMAFGFVVVKFALFVKQIAVFVDQKHGEMVVPNTGYSAFLGIALVVIGLLMTLLSYVRYKHIEKQLLTNNYAPSANIPLLFTSAIILVGLLLIIYLIQNV